MNSNNLAGTEISSNKSDGTGQSESLAEIGKDLAAYKMNELEEVEGTNKKISKQQGLQSSNSKQQVEQQAPDLELTSEEVVHASQNVISHMTKCRLSILYLHRLCM